MQDLNINEMQLLTIIILVINPSIAFGQKPLVQYDLRSGSSDTLDIPSFDTTMVSENTSYFIGNFGSQKTQLSYELATSDTYANSHFSLKNKVEPELDPNIFPVLTSLKIFLSKMIL